MKKKIILALYALVGASFALTSCGGNGDGGSTPEIELLDTRVDAFTVVSGSMEGNEFVADGDTYNFKSLYEAANFCFDECDYGSFVKALGDETDTILYQKRMNFDIIDQGLAQDTYYYIKDGSTVFGFNQYLPGNTNYYLNEKVTTLMQTTDNLKHYYQPYSLLKQVEGATTQAWNLTPLLDTTIRYNPTAFSGMRTITFKIDLSESKIRPSYNETQKIVPMITLSSTDSYNWSNQGIYMDDTTGNWYYVYGETQSDITDLNYEENLILTSTWDNEVQEFTPDGDITLTLDLVEVEEDVWANDLTIVVSDKNGNETTHEFNYEYSQMNGRGTPRCNIALDLRPRDEDSEDGTFAPDYMCGAYFKNITVSEGRGTVPEGLTDDEYLGDTPMVGTAGQTYDLLASDTANECDGEVILDHYDCINYHNDITTKDVFDITYEQRVSASRTDEVLACEKLIAAILPTDDKDSASVIKASAAYNKLDGNEQRLIVSIDGYTQLNEALER